MRMHYSIDIRIRNQGVVYYYVHLQNGNIRPFVNVCDLSLTRFSPVNDAKQELCYGAALKSESKVVRPKTSALLLYQCANFGRLMFLIVQHIHGWVAVLIIFPTVA